MGVTKAQARLLTDVADGAIYHCHWWRGTINLTRNGDGTDGRIYRSLEALRVKGLVEFPAVLPGEVSMVSITDAGRKVANA